MNDLDNVIQQVIKSRGIKGRIDNTSNMGEISDIVDSLSGEEAMHPQNMDARKKQEEHAGPIPVKPIILMADNAKGQMKEITDRLEQGLQDLFESDRFREYLKVMSKFHNYSVNNTLLITMQKPDATHIAGFSVWKNNFGRNVMKGQKGIKIIAPSPFKIKQEMVKTDPRTYKPVIGKDGKPVTEEKEITIPVYKVVNVFDVSQTEGKELPMIGVDELTGSVERYNDFFKAVRQASPVPVGFEAIGGGTHGYYHLGDKRIAIDGGMSELQSLKTLIHEIAHARLHDIDLKAPKDQQAGRSDRRTREVQAESVAYAVCQYFGLDTSDYSFRYVATWSSGRELPELKESLEVIRHTSAELIEDIRANYTELIKDHGQERQTIASSQEPLTNGAVGKIPQSIGSGIPQKVVQTAERTSIRGKLAANKEFLKQKENQEPRKFIEKAEREEQ